MNSPVNVSQVKHLSPFRYPGGKTWLVPHVLKWLAGLPRRPETLIEPFAGGAIVGLSALASGAVDRLELVELDGGVASVWGTIFHGDAEGLSALIRGFDMTLETVREILDHEPDTELESAFQTIIRNRAQRGGVMAPGAGLMKSGDGRGIASRWYPETLAKRIDHLQQYRGRVFAHNSEGLNVMERSARNPTVAMFVDPPYTAGGKSAGSRLYLHNHLDHDKLFRLAASAAGPAMLTYDDCAEVLAMVHHYGLTAGRVPMKTGHHALASELVITTPGVAK